MASQKNLNLSTLVIASIALFFISQILLVADSQENNNLCGKKLQKCKATECCLLTNASSPTCQPLAATGEKCEPFQISILTVYTSACPCAAGREACKKQGSSSNNTCQ